MSHGLVDVSAVLILEQNFAKQCFDRRKVIETSGL